MGYKTLRVIALSLVLGMGTLTSFLSTQDEFIFFDYIIIVSEWWKAWLQNFSTGMFGSFVTYLLIEIMVEGRERETEKIILQKKESEKEAKERRSKQSQYLDALKKSANFQDRQNLVDEMRRLDLLQDINLWEAVLENINFKYANLRNAYLAGANLKNALLDFSDMSEVNLEYADLENASLRYTNFSAANLKGANIRNSKIENGTMNERTILPDGNFWSQDEDIKRFIDPKNANFWNSGIS